MPTEVWQVVGWNVLNGRNEGEARTDRRTRDGYWQVRANEEGKCKCKLDSERDREAILLDERAQGKKKKKNGGRKVGKCNRPKAAATLLLLMFT